MTEMAIELLVSIEGNFSQALDSLDKAIGDEALMVWLGDDVERHLYTEAVNRFAGGGDQASGKWAPLSQYTIADRVQRGFDPGPPEVRSGALAAYIMTGGDVSADGDFLELKYPGTPPGNHEMQMKVAVAQTGAVAHNGSRATPARPVLAIGPADVEAILYSLSERIGAYIAAGV